MATVLVTGVGGVGGVATVRSLDTHSDHELVGVDMNPRSRGFFLLDHVHEVPAADSDEWLSAMTDVIDEHDVDAVVPLVDEELLRLAELRETVSEDVEFVAPRQEVIDLTVDKRRLARWASRHEQTAPEAYFPTEGDELTDEFPLVVKPRFGHGSRDVERIDSRASLENYLAWTGHDLDDLLFQEYVDGVEFTTSVTVTADGRLLSVVPKEVVEKNGNTTWGATRSVRAVERSCRRLHEKLDPRGPMNVQQILDPESGDVYTIEINPRFSSTACLTVAAGVDELDLLIRDALGQPIEEPESFETDLHMVRHTDQFLVRESQLSEDGFPTRAEER